MFEQIINTLFAQRELFLRLLFACFCGGIIGFERSIRRKDAGIKTHIILALGAALFMIVSQYGFSDLHLSPEFSSDASRIASNIVTGVSFLCAGVIFVRGASVKGLTTATGIWTTAGIGMAAGAGMYAITFFATCLIIVIQLLLSKLSAKIETHYALDVELALPSKVKVEDVVGGLSDIIKSSPTSIKLVKNGELKNYKLNFNIEHTINEVELMQKISENEYVSNVSWAAL
ncbi:MAG: MgtC/SapB family protein [Eubacteriales bacterium]